MHFGILQNNSKLNQTTTILLLLLYDYNPPKRISKFKNHFLSAILTNTLQAGVKQVPILNFYLGLGPTLPSLHHWTLLSPQCITSTTCQALEHGQLDKYCHAVAWHATTMPLSPLAISGPNHHVNSLPLTSLDTLVHPLDQD
jgi:hypothetical protein